MLCITVAILFVIIVSLIGSLIYIIFSPHTAEYFNVGGVVGFIIGAMVVIYRLLVDLKIIHFKCMGD
jgi:uncharacterized membrane protein